MKRNWGIALTVLFAGSVLTGCECKHENWIEANCTEAKKCEECGIIEGVALGHTWKNADCQNPKTCEACGETEGKPGEHSWVNATMNTPFTCNQCGETNALSLSDFCKQLNDEYGSFYEITVSDDNGNLLVTAAIDDNNLANGLYTAFEAVSYYNSYISYDGMYNSFYDLAKDAEDLISQAYDMTDNTYNDISLALEENGYDCDLSVIYYDSVKTDIPVYFMNVNGEYVFSLYDSLLDLGYIFPPS